jgi:hypothetical protein
MVVSIKCFLCSAVLFVLGLQLLVARTCQQVILFVCKCWRALSFSISFLLCYMFHLFGNINIVEQIRWEKSPAQQASGIAAPIQGTTF